MENQGIHSIPRKTIGESFGKSETTIKKPATLNCVLCVQSGWGCFPKLVSSLWQKLNHKRTLTPAAAVGDHKYIYIERERERERDKQAPTRVVNKHVSARCLTSNSVRETL